MKPNRNLFTRFLGNESAYHIDRDRFWSVVAQLRLSSRYRQPRTYQAVLTALYARDGSSIATQDQAACQFGVTGERIRQLEAAALALLRRPSNFKRLAYGASRDELKPLDWNGKEEPRTWEERFEQGLASLSEFGLSTRACKNIWRNAQQGGTEFREGRFPQGRLLEFDEWIEQVAAGSINLLKPGWYSFGRVTHEQLLTTIARRAQARSQTVRKS